MSLANSGSLDTNVLLRWLLGDVPDQYAAAKKMIESTSDIYFVDILAIAEVAFILEGQGFTREEVAINIQCLMGRPNLYIMRSVVSPAIVLYLQERSLSLMDCLLVFAGESDRALPLHTFDRKLSKKSGGRAQLVTV